MDDVICQENDDTKNYFYILIEGKVDIYSSISINKNKDDLP